MLLSEMRDYQAGYAWRTSVTIEQMLILEPSAATIIYNTCLN